MAATKGSRNLKRGNIAPGDAAPDPGVPERDLSRYRPEDQPFAEKLSDENFARFGTQPNGSYLKPPQVGNTGGLERHRAETEAMRQRVADDPDKALEEIHKDLTSLTKKILKRAERSGTAPDRATMDVVREFRQTQEAVNEARRARGAVAGTEQFFDTLGVRLAEAVTRLGVEPQPASG